MPLPVNIQTFLDTVGGNTSPITEKNFNASELGALKQTVLQRLKANRENEENLKNLQLNTPQEYRLNPDKEMVQNGKSFTSQDVPYVQAQQNLQNKIDSYSKDRSKTSFGYGDYPIASGENAAPVGQGWKSMLEQSAFDPAFRMAATLGSANAYDRGDHYEVQDKYKFNGSPLYRVNENNTLPEIIKKYYDQPGSLGEVLFRKYLGNRSRDVSINIPK
jgi:hypothetical protein